MAPVKTNYHPTGPVANEWDRAVLDHRFGKLEPDLTRGVKIAASGSTGRAPAQSTAHGHELEKQRSLRPERTYQSPDAPRHHDDCGAEFDESNLPASYLEWVRPVMVRPMRTGVWLAFLVVVAVLVLAVAR